MTKSYRDLIAWQKGIDLVEAVYLVTASFPKHEIYGLSAQLRRAAVSIPSNIAEGQGRFSKIDFKRFLNQARGSLMELETQIIIASRLKYVDEKSCSQHLQLCAELGRILNGLITSIKEELDSAAER